MDTITPRPRPLWLAGREEQGSDTRTVTHPHDATEVATVAVPDATQAEHAVATAARFAGGMRSWDELGRAQALDRVAGALAKRAEEFTEMITAEAGKPLTQAEAEVADAAAALRAGARSAGETRPLDGETGEDGALTLRTRVPRGPLLAVLPAHRPLCHAAHAVAAAFAVATPVLLVPSPRAPLSALGLGELLAEAGIPGDAFSVLPLDDAQADILAADPRLTLVPDTEQEGRAVTVVLADWPDPEEAARAAAGTLGAAGPFGRTASTVVVERALATTALPALTEAVRSRLTGDPYDTAVTVAPLVDSATATATVSWIDSAVAAGAQLLCGGSRNGRTVEPTLLDVTGIEPPGGVDGAFGPPPSAPVLTVSLAESAQEALATTGARMGVFTRDVRRAAQATVDQDAREVLVASAPGYRAETVRSTMRRITEERITVVPRL